MAGGGSAPPLPVPPLALDEQGGDGFWEDGFGAAPLSPDGGGGGLEAAHPPAADGGGGDREAGPLDHDAATELVMEREFVAFGARLPPSPLLKQPIQRRGCSRRTSQTWWPRASRL